MLDEIDADGRVPRISRRRDVRIRSSQGRRAQSSGETRFDALYRKIDRLDAKIENRFSKREVYIDERFVAFGAKIDRFDTKFIGELSLVKWMIGFFLASVAVNDAKLFLR
jgi:hypothetical protein